MADKSIQKKSKRIVIKIGTSSLTHSTGKLNYRIIGELTCVIADLKNAGYEIVLVSSGAIGVGVGKMNLTEKPSDVSKKQALAAIGQCSLMAIYEKNFSEYGYSTAQVLLTKTVLDDKESYNNIVNAFNTMFDYGVIPIVNENDVISTYEIEFGDNDTLSAYVSRFIKADLLIILSDIDGLYDSDPAINKEAKIISVVNEIDESIHKLAGNAGTRRGTGGMITKLNAASIVMEAGIDMVITNGSRPKDLYDILNGIHVGTLFCARKQSD